jgi:RNA polymerase sigma-B factor
LRGGPGGAAGALAVLVTSYRKEKAVLRTVMARWLAMGFTLGRAARRPARCGQMFKRCPEGTNSSPVNPLHTEAAMTTAAATTPGAALAERDDSELLALIRTHDDDDELQEAAREVLVTRYQSLVRGCVQRYRDSPEPVEDLMQAGYVGLLKAINNFDPVLGQNLAAYAQPCVSGEIKRHFRDKRWQIHVKRSAQELLLQVRRARGELAQDLGRSPRDDEMARHLGVSLDELRDAQRADYGLPLPFAGRPAVRPGRPGQPLRPDRRGGSPGRHTLDMESVLIHWSDLPEREQRILTMRFYGNMTQAEIGEQLGISQMHRLPAARPRAAVPPRLPARGRGGSGSTQPG